MLTTGIHYDKINQQYRSADQKIMTESQAEHYFDHNEAIPFNHIDFRHRHSMSLEAFFKEVDDQIRLKQLDMAPKIYGYGLNREHEIHYGFIVMEKIDCSLKDVCLKRKQSSLSHLLNCHENRVIIQLIDDLHHQGMIHGDLKPSNIGITFDPNGQIKRACFFDCSKIQHKDDSALSSHRFTQIANREMNHFKKKIESL